MLAQNGRDIFGSKGFVTCFATSWDALTSADYSDYSSNAPRAVLSSLLSSSVLTVAVAASLSLANAPVCGLLGLLPGSESASSSCSNPTSADFVYYDAGYKTGTCYSSCDDPAPTPVPSSLPTTHLPPTPDHEFDFRGCSDSTTITDTYDSDITATQYNGAYCSADGMVFDGDDDYVDLTPWEFGGTISVEYYVKLASYKYHARHFDFYDSCGTDNVFVNNRGTTSTATWQGSGVTFAVPSPISNLRLTGYCASQCMLVPITTTLPSRRCGNWTPGCMS